MTGSEAQAGSEAPSGTGNLRRDVRATLMPGFVGFTPPEWLLATLGTPGATGVPSATIAAGAFETATPAGRIEAATTTGTRGEGGDAVSGAVAENADARLLAVCVYGGNVRDARQLRELGKTLREASPGALIAIDEEGGEVTRLHYLEGSPYPGAAVLGRIDDPEYTAEIGARVGGDLLTHGFNLTLAPDVDVNSNPANPVIGTRSFGADADLVSRHAAAWVRGLESTGATACPKHFPGHGDTAQDSHLMLPMVNASRETLSERDLPPFAASFNAGARAVMTSHILLPEVDDSGPATFSRVILRDILRGELGFTGVVVSDALDMQGASGEIGIPEAAVRALGAGCDLLCIGTDTTLEQLLSIEDCVLDAVREGRLEEARVRDAAARVRALAASSTPSAGTADPAASQATIGSPSQAEIERIARSFSGVDAARAWLASHPRASVIRVDVESNMAVGYAPWGPFAARTMPVVSEAARAFEARPLHAVDTETPLPWLGASIINDGVIVIGRNMHRHAFARAGIDALWASGAPVLTVETGWPAATQDASTATAATAPSAPSAAAAGTPTSTLTSTPTSAGYADLATYGSSAIVGAALLELLADRGLEGGGDRASNSFLDGDLPGNALSSSTLSGDVPIDGQR